MVRWLNMNLYHIKGRIFDSVVSKFFIKKKITSGRNQKCDTNLNIVFWIV